MNKKNTLKVIEALEAEGEMREKFDMGDLLNTCGTAGCIAATATILAAREVFKGTVIARDCRIEEISTNFLGISTTQWELLCVPGQQTKRRKARELSQDVWGDVPCPILLAGPKGARKAANALRRAMEIWGAK